MTILRTTIPGKQYGTLKALKLLCLAMFGMLVLLGIRAKVSEAGGVFSHRALTADTGVRFSLYMEHGGDCLPNGPVIRIIVEVPQEMNLLSHDLVRAALDQARDYALTRCTV